MSFARSDLKALVGCERGRVGRVLPHSMRTANNATKTRCKRGHVRRALNYTPYYATFESSYQCKTRHVQHIINYNTRIKITRMFKVITHCTPHQHTTHTVSPHAKSPKTTPQYVEPSQSPCEEQPLLSVPRLLAKLMLELPNLQQKYLGSLQACREPYP